MTIKNRKVSRKKENNKEAKCGDNLKNKVIFRDKMENKEDEEGTQESDDNLFGMLY